MTYSTNGKEVLLDGAHFADADSPDAATAIAEAISSCPLQTFTRAQAIGELLHDRFNAMTGKDAPFAIDDMAWADIVQFVVRKARDPEPIERRTVDEAAPEGVHARYNEEAAPNG